MQLQKTGGLSVRRKCIYNDVVYKYIASATGFLNEIYLGTAQREFKKRFYIYNTSFLNETKRSDITLPKYVRDLKLKHNVTPTLKWHILKLVASYFNITKKYRLCLQEKFETLSYPNPDELIHLGLKQVQILLNNRSELASKCRHANKFLLAKYKGND